MKLKQTKRQTQTDKKIETQTEKNRILIHVLPIKYMRMLMLIKTRDQIDKTPTQTDKTTYSNRQNTYSNRQNTNSNR